MATVKVPIKLIKKVPVKGSDGNWTGTTDTVYTFWAEVLRQSGLRVVINSQDQLTNQMRFRVEFNPGFDLTGEWKVIYAGRKHTVSSIQRENEKRFKWIINAQSSGKN